MKCSKKWPRGAQSHVTSGKWADRHKKWAPTHRHRHTPTLHRQFHDSVNDVVVVILERLDRLALRHSGLLHYELDVLSFDSFVLLVFFDLGDSWFLGDWLRLLLELLSCGHLSLCAQIFDLGLAKNDVGIRSGAFINVWVADDKQDRLVFPDADTVNAGNGSKRKLGHSLAGFFLRFRLSTTNIVSLVTLTSLDILVLGNFFLACAVILNFLISDLFNNWSFNGGHFSERFESVRQSKSDSKMG